MMELKITQRLEQQFREIRNMPPRQIMKTDLIKTFLILVAITVLSFEGINLFYTMVSIPFAEKSVIKTNGRLASSSANAPHRQIQDYAMITERNLFLTTLKEAPGSEGEGIFDSEQKSSNFDLKGTVAYNTSSGYIFIEEHGSKKQKLYRLGDMIGPSKLVKITRNTATLRNGGRDITMKVRATIQDPLLPEAPEGRSATRNLALSKTAVNEKLNNLNTLMNKAIVRPYIKRGVQEGFIISNIAPDSLYEKMGLQNGDIIIDINNNKLRGADSLLQAVNLMQSGSSITLNIKRRGKDETINYTFH